MGRRAQWLAAVTAVVAWAALALQLGILVADMAAIGHGPVAALWRFLGFFTVLTNGLVAVVTTGTALHPAGRLATARLRLMAVVSIVLVGILYALLLRHVWNPTGWQAVADHMLHEAVPLLFLLVWLIADHGGLGWRDALWAMLPPVLYLAYALARGAADGWYAYWFLDPAQLGDTRMAINAGVLAAVFLATALVFLGLDRWLARRSTA